MSVGYTFKKHPLTPDQKLWLAEVARTSPPFSPRAARVALQGRVAPDFSTERIDPRLYAHRRLTPVGLWHVDPRHPQFEAMDKTIRAIRGRILRQPDLKSVTAAEIAVDTGMTERQVGEAMFAAGELSAPFFTKADGVAGNPAAYSQLYLPDDDIGDDEYLNYTGVEDLLERFYTARGHALWGAVTYSEKLAAQRRRAEDPNLMSEEAASAVYAAIETCIEYDGRAYVGNVPSAAETVLLNDSGGTLDTAEAVRLIKDALVRLSQEGKIDAPIERHRDWRILKPMMRSKRGGAVSNKNVFIVHGHNGEAKESVARFVEKLGLEAIILHERPNKGRTIITKFQEESQGVGFAVVLMTPDDEGRAINAPNMNPRARQNVVLELGFFIGKLGPERVAAVVKGSIERPSDFDGVVYISLDEADWRTKLASEFKAAGLEADWSKILP